VLLAAVLACWRRPLPRLAACSRWASPGAACAATKSWRGVLPPQLEGRDLPVRLCVEGLPLVRHDARGKSWRLRGPAARSLPGASGTLARWQGRRLELGWYGRRRSRPARPGP